MTKKRKKKDKKSQVSQALHCEPAPTEINLDKVSHCESSSNSLDYDDSLIEKMNPWKALASENRKQGLKTVAELLRDSGGIDEEIKAALEPIKSKVVALGAKLSRLIVEYIFEFWSFDAKEKFAKTRSIGNTIRHLRLEDDYSDGPSAVIDGLIAAIELVDDEIEFPRVHYNDEKGAKDHEVVVNQSDAITLRMICFQVLWLEIAYGYPGLNADEKDSIERISERVAKGDSFEKHLDSLEKGIEIFKALSLRDNGRVGKEIDLENVEDTQMLKDSICFNIEKIWSQF